MNVAVRIMKRGPCRQIDPLTGRRLIVTGIINRFALVSELSTFRPNLIPTCWRWANMRASGIFLLSIPIDNREVLMQNHAIKPSGRLVGERNYRVEPMFHQASPFQQSLKPTLAQFSIFGKRRCRATNPRAAVWRGVPRHHWHSPLGFISPRGPSSLNAKK